MIDRTGQIWQTQEDRVWIDRQNKNQFWESQKGEIWLVTSSKLFKLDYREQAQIKHRILILYSVTHTRIGQYIYYFELPDSQAEWGSKSSYLSRFL
jgi:hypothetical protein